jgi:hypothetical protein
MSEDLIELAIECSLKEIRDQLKMCKVVMRMSCDQCTNRKVPKNDSKLQRLSRTLKIKRTYTYGT